MVAVAAAGGGNLAEIRIRGRILVEAMGSLPARSYSADPWNWLFVEAKSDSRVALKDQNTELSCDVYVCRAANGILKTRGKKSPRILVIETKQQLEQADWAEWNLAWEDRDERAGGNTTASG
ncbi:hypothetical protein M406DRAFT_323748 [Cryphonectria parasitica EP155]|uniref:Uncharacterized protein n=1 Tax=Cryphonectria parasitica (strain ATCC 38755 / EP155) TaxID=660469 RepID=A0A9P4XX22_CRYP1|nr:uncharacterized protein M406DRAFT_323748 [Cryphonectria parasitica EP155]KAF3762922.1 hypothetical protein M406DRAFT_323748 [Cryphonectria parasitica EP155]